MAFIILIYGFYISLNLFYETRASLQSCIPDVCVCKWKSGKQSAECVKQGLFEVPSNLNPETQILNLDGNPIETLEPRIFQKKGLVNLQKVYLPKCDIMSIAPDAFFQLSNMIEIDLSYNKLQEIPSESFRDCRLLRRLILGHNQIEEISNNSFSLLPHLTTLDLSHSGIRVIHDEAFKGLEKLLDLKLEDNNLITLPLAALKPLNTLSSLHLHGNPWDCDCRIGKVRKWMIDQNIPLAAPPHCASPKQTENVTWALLSLDDFACAPNVFTTHPVKVKALEGQNLTLECQIKSTPKSIVDWETGGRSITNMSFYPEFRGKYNIELEGKLTSEVQFSRMTITNIAATDDAIFSCVAENKAGNSSIDFTISVLFPHLQEKPWGSIQIALVTVSSFFIILIALLFISGLIFHPEWIFPGAKVRGANLLSYLRNRPPESVEMTERINKEEKEVMVTENPPGQESGSSENGSNQLTPDLVSKIGDVNRGTSYSTSIAAGTYRDIENSSLNESYGTMSSDTWMAGRVKTRLRYKDSPDGNPHMISEIYPNPCFGKDDPQDLSMPSTSFRRAELDRYAPQNDRVRALRACIEGSGSVVTTDIVKNDGRPGPSRSWRRSLAGSSTAATHYALSGFSPDESYADEGVQGTEV